MSSLPPDPRFPNPYLTHAPLKSDTDAVVSDSDQFPETWVNGTWLERFRARDPNRRWWTPMLMALISFPVYFVVSMVAATAVVIAISGFDGLTDIASFEMIGETRSGFLFMVVAPQLFLIVPSIAASILSPVPLHQRLGLVRGHWPYWAWLAAGVGTPLVGMITGVLVSQFFSESESLKEMSGIFRNLGTGLFALVIALAVGITPAVCEEILFRGYIQTRLTKALPVWIGILFSSILFSVYHLDPVHIIAVFPMGMYLGWVSYRSGSLFPAMLGHFVNNFISVLMVVFAAEGNVDTLALPGVVTALSILSLGSLGLMLTLYASIAFPSPGPHLIAAMPPQTLEAESTFNGVST
jgi:uncharacterized protein